MALCHEINCERRAAVDLPNGWMCCDSSGKHGSTLAEFAQLPTTKVSAAAVQQPCCFDDILEHGITATGSDVSSHACALYSCHLEPEVCQPQRMRSPHFLCDTDSAMWRHFRRRRHFGHVLHTFPTFRLYRTTEHILEFLKKREFVKYLFSVYMLASTNESAVISKWYWHWSKNQKNENSWVIYVTKTCWTTERPL